MIEQQSQGQAVGQSAAPLAGQSGVLAVRATSTRTGHAKLRPYERNFLWLSRLIIWVFGLLVMIPIALVIIASFQQGSAFYTNSIIPTKFSLEHYGNIFDPNKTQFFVWLKNSAIVCIGTGVLSVMLVASTGYAFSRFRFVGRKYGLMGMLLIQMFPAQMSFVAFFYLLYYIHILDTLQGLILVFLGGGIPFFAWLFKGYVDGLPRDLEESAYVDGATRFQAFWKVILPLTRPMMAVIFIFQIIGIYNDYILTNFLITDPNKYTMAVGLYGFISGQFSQNWPDFAAGALLASIPIVVIFLAAQKWLVSGLAAGAVKG